MPIVARMPEFLVELYVPRTEVASAAASAERAQRAAQELSSQGITIRYLRSIFVPDDETCFQLYMAPSIEAVRDLGARAGLQFERISEVMADRRRPQHMTRATVPGRGGSDGD